MRGVSIICLTLTLALTAAGMSAHPALACSPVIYKTAKQAYDESDLVFLGRATQIRQELLSSSPDGLKRYVREHVVFVVEKAWKNAKVGDRITFASEIGPGPCGASAINDPPGIVEILKQPNGSSIERPMELSGRWLVYAFGPEPYSLGDARSMPVEDVPFVNREMRELDRITNGR